MEFDTPRYLDTDGKDLGLSLAYVRRTHNLSMMLQQQGSCRQHEYASDSAKTLGPESKFRQAPCTACCIVMASAWRGAPCSQVCWCPARNRQPRTTISRIAHMPCTVYGPVRSKSSALQRFWSRCHAWGWAPPAAGLQAVVNGRRPGAVNDSPVRVVAGVVKGCHWDEWNSARILWRLSFGDIQG